MFRIGIGAQGAATRTRIVQLCLLYAYIYAMTALLFEKSQACWLNLFDYYIIRNVCNCSIRNAEYDRYWYWHAVLCVFLFGEMTFSIGIISDWIRCVHSAVTNGISLYLTGEFEWTCFQRWVLKNLICPLQVSTAPSKKNLATALCVLLVLPFRWYWHLDEVDAFI